MGTYEHERSAPEYRLTADPRKESGLPDSGAETLDWYFNNLEQTSQTLLTSEQEKELAGIIQQGIEAGEVLSANDDLGFEQKEALESRVVEGMHAFNYFVESNLRLVVKIAAQFNRWNHHRLEDLVQEGNIGLMRAVEKFDPSRGYRFSTYAKWHIRHSVQRALEDKERTIRLPSNLYKAVTKVIAAYRRIETELGRRPTHEELAKATKLSKDMVNRAMYAEGVNVVASLDDPLIEGEENSGELGDIVAEAEDVPEKEAVDNIFTQDVIRIAQQNLSPHNWHILQRRFGLNGGEPATLEQIRHEIEGKPAIKTVRAYIDHSLTILRNLLSNPDSD